MTLTTLVTHIAAGDPEALDAGLTTPFALAEAFSAHLTALVFPIETGTAATATPGLDPAAAEERALAHLRAVAERRGISCEIRSRSSFAYGVGEVFGDHLRVSDLGVFTLNATRGVGQRALLSAAIFDSGRPVLMVRQNQPLRAPPSRIIVAWDATPGAVRAVHGALPFIQRAAETLVVTVSDDKDVRTGQSGIELTHLLARHGAKARFSEVRRDGGSVLERIMAAAQDAEADLLVMGAVRHSPLRNITMGSATQDLLDRGLRLPTLVAA